MRTQDRVAERSAHPVEDRGAGEERHLTVRDAVKEFRAQVITHVTVIAGKSEADLALPCAGPYRQRGDVQPGRPALGALDEFAGARHIGLHTCALKQRGCFLGAHRQIVGADLDDPALNAQACRRQRHFGARSQRELPSKRKVQGKLGYGVQAPFVRDRLDMVEHQGDRQTHRCDRGHEFGDDGDTGARGGQRPEHRRVNRFDPVQRNREGTQQNDGVVVSVIAGDPRHARPDPFGPLGQERCLAITGWGDDGDDRRLGSCQPVD